MPAGYPGNVHVYQSLGAAHDFTRFEFRYLLNIPPAYFTAEKIALYLCIQAGESGYFVWSSTRKPLASIAERAGQDVVITLDQDDFKTGGAKKRARIELIGLQINRNGSTVAERILLKRITAKLPE